MSAPETNVEFATRHRDLFDEVREHNLFVSMHRMRGGDWDSPDHQYRNAWAEGRARDAAQAEA